MRQIHDKIVRLTMHAGEAPEPRRRQIVQLWWQDEARIMSQGKNKLTDADGPDVARI